MIKEKIYFPNLNGLRFIAAFLVIIHHTEQIKELLHIDNYWDSIPFVKIIGKLGVILFFVLSGFLITYLLLAEEDAAKTISIRKFYIRRIIRIWPLYFLIIILAFLILPHINIFAVPGFSKELTYSNLLLKLLLYAIFLPNLVLSALGVIPYASHTWSIGTEEQFYLVWPVILKNIKSHRIFLMLFIIVFYLIITFFLTTHFSDFLPYKAIIQGFWLTFNIDCMSIGGIFAILLFQKNKLLRILLNKYLFYFTIITIVLFMIFGIYIPYLHYEVYSVFFGIVILNFACNDKIDISLENKLLNYLGNISYGLYMYHPMAIVLSLYICNYIDLRTNWLIYPLTFGLTILIAGFSYKYYEAFFLKYKSKFSTILSGNKPK